MGKPTIEMAIVLNAKPKCLLKFYMEKYHKDLLSFVLTAGLKLMAVYGLY